MSGLKLIEPVQVSGRFDMIKINEKKYQSVNVLICPISKDEKREILKNKLRQKEIENCKNEKVKNQKYFVWKTLEKALKMFYEKDAEEFDFKKNENGKLISDKIFVSLSHSNNFTAVALSDFEVGIDIEEKKQTKKNFLIHIKNGEESLILKNPVALWTRKESVFKKQNLKTFVPSQINTMSENVKTFECENFFVSVAGQKEIEINLQSTCDQDIKEVLF